MSDIRPMAKQALDGGRARLVWALGHVPDDRLSWSPAPTAKNTLQIIAHVVASNRFMATAIRGGPVTSLPDNDSVTVPNRAEAIRLIEESAADAAAAIDSAPADIEGKTVQTPFGEAPVSFFMTLPGRHMDSHASQLEYLQTCWGDTDYHWND